MGSTDQPLSARGSAQVRRLAELLTAYAKAGDEATRKQILDEIERLKSRLAELGERLAKLRRDLPDGFVNPEALAERDLGDLDQLRQLIVEGRIEEAMRLLDAMRGGLTAWRDQMNRSLDQFGGDAYAGLRKRVEISIPAGLSHVSVNPSEVLVIVKAKDS